MESCQQYYEVMCKLWIHDNYIIEVIMTKNTKENYVVRVFKYTCDFGNLNVWSNKNKKLWMGSTFGQCFLKMENWNKTIVNFFLLKEVSTLLWLKFENNLV